MTDLAISCAGLVKRFGDVTAVAGVDLSVRRGECFGLLGPNGAGKTTTVEILEGLLAKDEGDVILLGQHWGDGDDRALRERLGIQLQGTELPDRLSAVEIVRMFRSFYAKGRGVDEVLELVGLTEKRDAWFMKMSGGQKQRLALACALVASPELLFLDEPTTGLDPRSRQSLWEVVQEFRSRGGTVVLTTHYMDEAARLCDRLAVMDHGRVIAEGSPAQLVSSLGADQIIEFEAGGEVAEDALAALPGVRGVKRRIDQWVLNVERLSAALPALLAYIDGLGVPLETVATHQATLDDVFLALTGRELSDE